MLRHGEKSQNIFHVNFPRKSHCSVNLNTIKKGIQLENYSFQQLTKVNIYEEKGDPKGEQKTV